MSTCLELMRLQRVKGHWVSICLLACFLLWVQWKTLKLELIPQFRLVIYTPWLSVNKFEVFNDKLFIWLLTDYLVLYTVCLQCLHKYVSTMWMTDYLGFISFGLPYKAVSRHRKYLDVLMSILPMKRTNSEQWFHSTFQISATLRPSNQTLPPQNAMNTNKKHYIFIYAIMTLLAYFSTFISDKTGSSPPTDIKTFGRRIKISKAIV